MPTLQLIWISASILAVPLYSYLAPYIAQYMHRMFHHEWFSATPEHLVASTPEPPTEVIPLPPLHAAWKQAPLRLFMSLISHYALFTWNQTANLPHEYQYITLGALHALLLGCYVDLEAMLIPDTLNFSGIWLPVIAALAYHEQQLPTVIVGILVGYLSPWTINFLYRLVRGHDGMGAGDFKLLAALLALSSYTLFPHLILYASVSACVAFVIQQKLLPSKGPKATASDPFPFGPFLLIGWALAILYPVNLFNS